jgi:MFS family permease
VAGRPADIVGRRRLYLVGLAVFTVAGPACGFATNAVEPDLMRAIRAVGAVSIVTSTTALLTDAFPPELLSLGLGLNVAIASAAQVVGPLRATTLGWRAVFWFNVPTGAVGLVWAMVVLRRSPRSDEPRGPFDFVGAVLPFVLGAPSCSRCPRAGRSGAPVVAAVIVFALAAPVFPLARRATAVRSPTCACSPTGNAPWPTSPRSCSRSRGSPSSCRSRCTSRPRTGPTRSRPGCAWCRWRSAMMLASPIAGGPAHR